MMTAEVVQISPGFRDKHWPLLVPRTILTQYQPVIGGLATLVWLNLYEMAEAGEGAQFASLPSHVADRTGYAPDEIQQAVITLEQAGLLQRTSGRWTLLWPAPASNVPAEVTPDAPGVSQEFAFHARDDSPPREDDGTSTFASSATFGAQETAIDAASGWNSDEAGLQAVMQFYHQRIGMLGPSQFEKLRFWVEDQGMSPDVVALAIEETVQSAPTPRMAYVEGVLRNWYNDGIRTLADLQNSKRIRSQEVPPSTEGTPNAASFAAVDREAVRRWKEMYSDEYDD